MALKKITLLQERVADWKQYPFTVPAIAHLREITIQKPVVFFVGENGSGKSTLLEAIASHYGFGKEGGTRSFRSETTDSLGAIDPLTSALRVAFTNRTGAGYYLRAESFFNIATQVDELGPEVLASYGGKSLHKQSHGESFLALARHKFDRNGLFVLDEPEAALSPQRQLSLLVLIHDTVRRRKDAQFVIATHSPILLAYPDAQILSFDGGLIHEIDYSETEPYRIYRRFLTDPERYMDTLFAQEPDLFKPSVS